MSKRQYYKSNNKKNYQNYHNNGYNNNYYQSGDHANNRRNNSNFSQSVYEPSQEVPSNFLSSIYLELCKGLYTYCKSPLLLYFFSCNFGNCISIYITYSLSSISAVLCIHISKYASWACIYISA